MPPLILPNHTFTIVMANTNLYVIINISLDFNNYFIMHYYHPNNDLKISLYIAHIHL